MTRMLAGLFLLMTATPLAAESFEGTGWLVTCGEEGCFLNAAGFDLFAAADGSPAYMDLTRIEPLSAIALTGDISNMGDSTADITVERVERVDNINEDNLRAIQGVWKPIGEEAHFHVAIAGLTWMEMEMDAVLTSSMMVLGPACADGVEPGGTAISLYREGDDPDADACWQLEYVDEQTLVLRDISGETGQVEFERLTE